MGVDTMVVNTASNELGVSLKNKLIDLIRVEGIDIHYTYEASFKQNGSFNFSVDNKKQLSNKSIVAPKLIDSVLKQAIILAHELGHSYVYKKNSRFKNSIMIGSNNSYLVYLNEKEAWKEAKRIIVDLGYWQDIVVSVFEAERIKALKSYRPMIFYNLFKLIKIWVSSYLLVSLFFILQQNDVPPFLLNDAMAEIIKSKFFSIVNGLFFLYLYFLLMSRMLRVK